MSKEIGVSLRDVLELESLRGAKVLAGEQGLKRSVSSINVMEVPDIIDWVSPGELIITTAYPFKNDVGALEELIKKLNTARVAGLGIKSKRFIGQVPPEVIEQAQALSFPIFEIPYSATFAEIITQTLTAILNRQAFVLREIQDLNHALTQSMLSGGNLQEICHILHQRLSNSVAIISDYLSAFVFSTTSDKQEVIARMIENEKKGHVVYDETAEGAIVSFRVRDQISDQSCKRIVIPIYHEKRMYGKIYMWEDVRIISSVEQSAVESSTSLIALDMMKKLSILEIENNNRAGFLDNLLSGERKQYQKAMLGAKLFDYDPSAAHQVIVLRLKRPPRHEVLSKEALYRLNTNIIAILRGLVKNAASKIIYANRGNSVVLLHQSPALEDTSYEKKINCFTDSLCERLRHEGFDAFVAVGVGRSYAHSAELYKSFHEAKRAAYYPHVDGCSAIYYNDIGVYRLLTYESIRAESELFCEEMLKPLLAYDEDKDSDIMKTLLAYFKCKGNLTKLAKELHVHYNTIIYRLQKIKNLLGIDLEEEKDLLDLQIALKIFEMKNNE